MSTPIQIKAICNQYYHQQSFYILLWSNLAKRLKDQSTSTLSIDQRIKEFKINIKDIDQDTVSLSMDGYYQNANNPNFKYDEYLTM